jgi:hypothetical protein
MSDAGLFATSIQCAYMDQSLGGQIEQLFDRVYGGV